jgi:hypothetical protein
MTIFLNCYKTILTVITPYISKSQENVKKVMKDSENDAIFTVICILHNIRSKLQVFTKKTECFV